MKSRFLIALTALFLAPLPAWAAGQVFQDCPECPQMVEVPAGSFRMGSPSSEQGRSDDEGPVHRVNIRYSFAVGVYEVTQGEYQHFVDETGYNHAGCASDFPPLDRDPVACISFTDAKRYLRWLSAKAGKRYRLLSESEWEYVARAGTTTRYHFGDNISSSRANYNQNEGGVVSVGSYPANAFGLHDVHGNVNEWVQDCWNEGYRGSPNDGSAWDSGDCSQRVLRGGSWGDLDPRFLRSADRVWIPTAFRSRGFGFRVARALTP